MILSPDICQRMARQGSWKDNADLPDIIVFYLTTKNGALVTCQFSGFKAHDLSVLAFVAKDTKEEINFNRIIEQWHGQARSRTDLLCWNAGAAYFEAWRKQTNGWIKTNSGRMMKPQGAQAHQRKHTDERLIDTIFYGDSSAFKARE